MTLEAQRVKKIDGLSGMEGVLRVEKEWLGGLSILGYRLGEQIRELYSGFSKGVPKEY